MVRIRKAATVGYIKNPRRPKDLNATYLDKYTDANIEPILRGYRIQNPRDKGTDATITELIKTTPNDLSTRETSLITYRDFGMEYALVKDKLEELAAALMEEETLEGDRLMRILGPAENRIMPDDEPASVATPPAPPAASSGGDAEDERPQGRPGLAWGQSSSAAPPAGE